MKKSLFLILYLNIYTAVFWAADAQQLELKIEAEETVNTSLLDSLGFQSRFLDYRSLVAEADSLLLRFQNIGYIESELQMLRKENDSVHTARFFLGRRYKTIKIFYERTLVSEKILQKISQDVTETYFTLPFPKLSSTLQKLNTLVAENGDPFTRTSLTNITKTEDGTLTADLLINTGNVRTIDSIVVKGYEKFPRSYLTYFAGVKKGKRFSQKKLVAQNDVLNGLGFVSTIKPPEALFRKNNTTVYFYLQKENNNLFDGILGFATNEDTQRLEFNGYLNLELNNNLNFGEQLLINYKADGNEQQNFRARVTMPYLFKTPFGIGAELQIFKRDSTFVTTQQQARVTYQINPASSTYIGYKGYESSNLLETTVAGTPVDDYTSRFAIAGLAYTKPQNSYLFPVKTFLSLDTEIGRRELRGTTESQQRISVSAQHIFNLNNKNSIYIQNTTSFLISDTYLTNELFRFGGINSIRGFNENSIDASLFSVLNTEYRYAFTPSIYIHSIIDLGYFENQFFTQEERLYSFGIGLGMRTKAGIFKFNIANGSGTQQDFAFANTKIHLSLTSRF
ncbi:MAG: hypothetical protein OQJ83_10650 [Altibacter sp.]|nr:hypothetical protein [Altibacter sp.]